MPTQKHADPNLMFVAFVDDSGSTGKNLQDEQSRFQVLGGPVIDGDDYQTIEVVLTVYLEELIPPEERDRFEFKARDLYHGHTPFDKTAQTSRFDLLTKTLELIPNLPSPVVCGIVDKARLQSQVFSSADPLDMAFKGYLQSLENWIASPQTPNKCSLLIADASKEKSMRRLANTFYDHRKRLRANGDAKPSPLYDDIYFGDSFHSLGIQLADLCVYFIARHLAGKADSEWLFQIIEKSIFEMKVHP